MTHDQEEAFEVADRVVLMNRGRVEQVGTPLEVFEEPATPFAMRFLGTVNVFRGRIHGGRARVGELAFEVPGTSGHGVAASVFVRPHELEIHASKVPDAIPAVVERVTPLGASVRVELASPSVDGPLAAEIEAGRASALGLAPGGQVYLTPRRVRVFADDPADSLTASGL